MFGFQGFGWILGVGFRRFGFRRQQNSLAARMFGFLACGLPTLRLHAQPHRTLNPQYSNSLKTHGIESYILKTLN